MTEKTEAVADSKYRLNVNQIRKFLPHRYPFLMIDRILEIHPKGNLSNMSGSEDKVGSRVIALKNVTINEPQFMGHFPTFAIFPGVMMIEAMAQTSSFISYPYVTTIDEKLEKGYGVILIGVDGVRLRKPVVPGDAVIIESTLTKCRSTIWGFDVVARVDGVKVAEASILANLTGENQ